MPEQVGAPRWRVGDPGALQRQPNHVGDRARACEGSVGRQRSEEYPIIIDTRPDPSEIIEQRVAGILRQWQADLPPSFATHPKRPLIPVEIVETHVENVAAAQAETNQQKQDCLVANAMRLREVTAGDEPFDISGYEI